MKCLSIFLVTVTVWHVYRLLVQVYPYLEYGKPLGYFFYLGFYVLIFAILVLFVKMIDRSSPFKIGLRKDYWLTNIIVSIIFAFLGHLLEVPLLTLFGGTFRISEYPDPFLIMFFIILTFIVGLTEESVFRGYIQSHLTSNYGFIKALLVTSILFGIYHINFFRSISPDVALIAFILAPSFGIFIGYFYYKIGENLLSPILFHMFYNLFGFTILPLETENQLSLSLALIITWSVLIIALKILIEKKIVKK